MGIGDRMSSVRVLTSYRATVHLGKLRNQHWCITVNPLRLSCWQRPDFRQKGDPKICSLESRAKRLCSPVV